MILMLFQALYSFSRYLYKSYARRMMLCDAAPETEHHQEACEVRNEISRDKDATVPKVELKFSPPAYMQRYGAVIEMLREPRYKERMKKIVDFGCAELGFLIYLKNLEGLTEILCVDIDKDILENNIVKAKPFAMDYIHCRKHPLTIEICCGSVTQSDARLQNTDAVICIELIEHMHSDELIDFPYNIFGYIRPKVAIITTPNADFNVLFPNFSGKRHPDHKFEWTRKQFEDWAHNIVMRYPSYSVTFHGICYGPEGTEEFGPCSQMAVFHLEREEKYDYVIQPPGPQNLFETVATFEYPTLKDTRSDEEKLVDDAIYYINFLAHHNEDRQEEIPLKQVLSLLKVSTSAEALKVLLLEHGMVVKDREDGPVALPFEESTSESSSNESDAGDFFDDVTRYNQYDPENMDGPLTADEESSLLQSSQTSDWNEDCILIPQNRSVVHENTLFDEEILPVDDFHASEVRPIHSSDSNNLTVDDTAGGITIEGLPSNSIPLSLNTNELNGKTQIIQSDELTIMLSTIPSNSSAAKHATKRLVDIVTIEPALSQEDELSLRSMQRASELNCQPHLSVSRSSTSPEPLYVSFGLNNSLQNCSTNQTESYQTKSLNNSFCHSGMVEASENVEYVTACSANGLNNSSRENHSQISKINLLENSGVSSCNNERADNIFDQITNNVNNIFENQPKFTSSPRKMVTTLQREDVNSDDPVSVDSNMISTRKAIEKTVSNIVENSLTLAIINEISKSIVDKYDVYKAWPSSNDIKKNNAAHRSIDWYSASKKTQQEIHSENGACRTSTSPGNKGTNGEYPAAKNVIDKETDAGNVQKIDAHVSSLYDTITRDDERRNVIPALSNVDDHAEVYPDNAQASDHSRANVNKRCLSPPRGFFGSKLRRNCKCSSECAKEASILEDELAPCTSNEDANNVQSTSMARNEESFDSVTREIVRYIHVTNISRFVDKVDTKPSSPLESPPNSWSPEVMDSGYPNTASAQDITPEYDLSSIAQDQIPDSESPSVAEAPRFGILEPIEVENGDLANNNRDDEGNNMMAADADDNEDLQPFIDVLENDLENENDIYVMQNGFPVWLLRILDMANPLDFDMQARQNLRAVDEVADDVNYAGRDEGFDSSSSENESDIVYNEMENDNEYEE